MYLRQKNLKKRCFLKITKVMSHSPQRPEMPKQIYFAKSMEEGLIRNRKSAFFEIFGFSAIYAHFSKRGPCFYCINYSFWP